MKMQLPLKSGIVRLLFLLICVSAISLNSCKKDATNINIASGNKDLSQKIKLFLNRFDADSKTSIFGRAIDWNSLEVVQINAKDQKIVLKSGSASGLPTKDSNYMIQSAGVFSIRDGEIVSLSQFEIYGQKGFIASNLKDILINYHAEEIPGFDGNFIRMNQEGSFEEMIYFKQGRKSGTKYITAKAEDGGKSNQKTMSQQCIYLYLVTYVNNVVTEVEYLGSSCTGGGINPCGWPNLVHGSAGELQMSSGCGGGGSGNPKPVTTPTPALEVPNNVIIPGADGPPVDIIQLIRCFTRVADQGAKCQVIIEVEQPVPGTSLNLDPNLIKGRSVGHTAITLIKTGIGGSIRQTIGFYPTIGRPFKSPSRIVNNAAGGGKSMRPTINMKFDVTPDNFNAILSAMSNPPDEYSLFNANCTGFVIAACMAGDITTPDAYTNVGIQPGMPGGTTFAQTPGALGWEMEKLANKGDKRVTKNPGTVQTGTGPCN